MNIPIDRYRLIGVTIGAENRAILDQLEKRIIHSKFSGFSNETIQKRRQLLEENTNILLNLKERKAYDEQLLEKTENDKGNEHGILVARGCEIAGILLLLEAGEEQDCLEVSEQLYREQRMNMSYFSTEYKELNKIIDHATLGFASKLEGNRHYETAAEVLLRRIRNHSVGMGEKEMINDMSKKLDHLLPFRILDLLSRKNDDRGHLRGISLLKEMVRNRGGLDFESNRYMDMTEFRAFFRQIRSYLSVQEQISLYRDWNMDGSQSAGFLLSIALVAQGFAQRKPSRICEALEELEKLNSDELKTFIGNIYLLLGDVKKAEELFKGYADEELMQWCTERSQNQLGSLCEWCREWLRRDVLKGYRDIDVEADLESYFADKDVISYIEKVESLGLRGKQRYMEQTEATVDDQQAHIPTQEDRRKMMGISATKNPGMSLKRYSKDAWSNLKGTRQRIKKSETRSLIVFGIIAITSCSLILFARLDNTQIAPSEIKRYQVFKESTLTSAIGNLDKVELLREALYKWHNLKKKTLFENRVQENSRQIATPGLLKLLETEMIENIKRERYKVINVVIEDIKISKEGDRKIEALAKLLYSDMTVEKKRGILKETKEHRFSRVYHFVWTNGKWLVDK